MCRSPRSARAQLAAKTPGCRRRRAQPRQRSCRRPPSWRAPPARVRRASTIRRSSRPRSRRTRHRRPAARPVGSTWRRASSCAATRTWRSHPERPPPRDPRRASRRRGYRRQSIEIRPPDAPRTPRRWTRRRPPPRRRWRCPRRRCRRSGRAPARAWCPRPSAPTAARRPAGRRRARRRSTRCCRPPCRSSRPRRCRRVRWRRRPDPGGSRRRTRAYRDRRARATSRPMRRARSRRGRRSRTRLLRGGGWCSRCSSLARVALARAGVAVRSGASVGHVPCDFHRAHAFPEDGDTGKATLHAAGAPGDLRRGDRSSEAYAATWASSNQTCVSSVRFTPHRAATVATSCSPYPPPSMGLAVRGVMVPSLPGSRTSNRNVS